MEHKRRGLLAARTTFLAALGAFGMLAAAFPDPPKVAIAPPAATEKAVLAGGCFWGMEGVFESLKGVTSAVSGYSGGSKENAHYDIVSGGRTGHAESVQVTFDPTKISYGEILKVYFSIAHDPTELNRQGPDDGTQYRSAIFFASDDQKKVATAYIQELTAAKTFKSPIVTQVVPLVAFYPAEDYHQHFLQKNPTYPYIVYNDLPKIEALKKTYPAMVK